MKHTPQSELKKNRVLIAISVIKNLISQDKIKEAVEVCIKNKISGEQFGIIIKNVEMDIKEIYNLMV